VLGSLTSYAIGYYGAEPFVKKFGKYLRIKQQDIEKTHTIFEKYGDRIILISRFIPVVRQFSSIPAGAAKMNIKKFVVYTAIGSTLWNSAILGLGYTVGINSEKFETYSGFIDITILLLVLFFVLFIIWKKKYNKK
jgi:membrane protein DedA with SNARE-associated domain